jgi:urease accessory protein
MNLKKWTTPTPRPPPLPSEGREDSAPGNVELLNQVHGFNARILFRENLSPAPSGENNHAPALPRSEGMDFILWQLADSAFPTGGFAHSNGLEAAWQHGEVRGRDDLLTFLEASLEQLGHGSLPMMLAAFDDPKRLVETDAFCDAFLSNHVANRASRIQGRAFLTAVERVFKPSPETYPRLLTCHYAPVFGASLRALNTPREMAIRLFFFNHLRSVLAAAVRLNIVGPMEAQTLQHKLSATAEETGHACKSLPLDAVAQTAPLLDLWQGAQDRLYSRLFQS